MHSETKATRRTAGNANGTYHDISGVLYEFNQILLTTMFRVFVSHPLIYGDC